MSFAIRKRGTWPEHVTSRRRRTGVHDEQVPVSSVAEWSTIDVSAPYKMSLVSSHQRLDMDGQKSGSPRFERKKGVFVERWVILLVLFLVACAIVAVGLLVGYLGPCSSGPEHHSVVSVTTESSDAGKVSTSTQKTPDEKLNVRLPRNIVPEHYWVELQPYLVPGNFTFDGRVEVVINCTEETQSVSIHFLNMTIYNDSVRLTEEDGSKTDFKNLKFGIDDKRQFFIVNAQEKLKVNKRYRLSMRFTGILNDILAGFYRSSYKENGTDKWLAITQFEPTDARRAFPCFDEPAMKATFDITLVKWKNMSAISNMPPIKTESRDGDWEAVTFGTTPKMSTYLLAFLVSQFANRTNTTDGRTFSVWSVPGAINSTAYALDIGPRILNHYDKFFETVYPLNKTDNAAVPDFSAGAMENWGLVTYRETLLLYDKLTSSSSNKQRICQTVAHELAHQWFGNLVTPTWWDDLWLNEGFASYMEYLGCSFVEPTWGMDQQMVIDNVHSAMSLDVLKSSHPIYVPVNNPAEINEIFDTISYDKGASVIRMMEKFLGNDTFTRGLKTYLQVMAYKNAASIDLWNALAEAYKAVNNNSLDVAAIMNTWTTQKGFPIVSVTRNYGDKSATVTQRKFMLEKSNDTSDNTSWCIPLTWTDNTTEPETWSTTTKMWLNSSTGQAPVTISNLSDGKNWMIFNVQEVGYYKVNYDMDNWKMLVQQLQDNHTKIHVINRAQILDDIFDLARSYEVNYTLAMNTTLYLSKETEYTPWSTAIVSFSYLNYMLRRSDAYGQWMAYVTKLLVPNYNVLGWTEDLDKEDILKQYLRITTISQLCSYDYSPCVDMAVKKFNDWKNKPTDDTIIPPNFRNVVYCTAIKNSRNASDWEFVWQRYLKEDKSSEKSKLMYALSCTQELWLLSKYLRLSLDNNSPIRKQDALGVFTQVAKNNYGQEVAFNMMRDQWDTIFNVYGGASFSFGDLVKDVTKSMNTPFEAQQLKDFYKSLTQEKLGTAKRAFQQAIETVESNVKFMKDHYSTIANWLQNNSGG